MYIVEVSKKFNAGSHIFDLVFNTLEDAQNAIKALLLSSDIISTKLK